MTANHAHTPTTIHVRFAATFPNEKFSLKGTDFDRWLAARDARIEAAAEQRGAIKALRDAATAIEKNQIMTQVGHLQPCNSCMVIHMDFLDYRADLLEGDE